MCDTPELYSADLDKLQQVMGYVDLITSSIDGLYAIEIRVKTDDVDSWAVIGWGESIDPALLRFECDGSCEQPDTAPLRISYPNTVNINPFESIIKSAADAPTVNLFNEYHGGE